jgi:site-specific DNA-methyltransferase (adenine-specific)
MEHITIYNEDCFEAFKKVKDKSVNLFLLDLPYGQTACKWDSVIDLEKMWKEIKRTLVKDGIVVMFCTTKFGFTLIQSNPKWFKYDLVWKKSRKVGFLSANKMPLRQHEMVYVFKDKQGTYNPQKTEGEPYNKTQSKLSDLYGMEDKEAVKTINKGDRHPTSIVEKEADHEMMYVFKDKQGTYNPQKSKGHKTRIRSHNKNADVNNVYGDGVKTTPADTTEERHPTSIVKDLGLIEPEYKGVITDSCYSLFKRQVPNPHTPKHPTSVVDDITTGIENTILEYKNPFKTVHKTQKPVDLCEWLIKSYSNEGDVVMDFCMGSGTTGIACKNTKRKFIGVEMDKDIFEIAKERIEMKHL